MPRAASLSRTRPSLHGTCHIIAAAAFAITLPLAASAAGNATGNVLLAQDSNTAGTTMAPAKSFSAASKSYVEQAAMTDRFEIMSSKLALKQSKNADIKKFAQQMITDHNKSTEKLKAVILKDKLDVKPPMKLDEAHAKLMKELESAKGADFDKLYAKIQTEGHEEALKLHQTYAENGDQPDLKSFAGEVSKVVEMHLSHITDINKALH